MERLRVRLPLWGALLLKAIRRTSSLDAWILVVALGLALALRLVLFDFKSLDFYASLKPWYNTIRAGGFGAFATNFSTYNPPYLYLLYLVARFLPDISVVAAVKLPSLLADYVCAYFVGRIVKVGSPQPRFLPYMAASAVLFAPSVVLNSAFWGQADSLLAAGILACVFYLMIRRPVPAMLAFGVALAFKLQAVFLAPVLLALAAKGYIPWKSFLYIPLVLLIAILPAWAAGRPLAELLGVYAYQTSQFEFITMNAPSVYAWLPDTKRVFNLMYTPGIIMGAAATLVWFTVLYKSSHAIAGRLLAEVALVSVLVVPLFLPKMHERYFYLADLLAIVVGFLYPRLWLVPLAIIAVSSASYQPFLFERALVPLPVLGFALVGVSAYLCHHALKQLRPGLESQTVSPDTLGIGVHARPERRKTAG